MRDEERAEASPKTSPGAADLRGQVAVVSGVGPGLGRSIAVSLAAAGASVALAARREATLSAVAAEIAAAGGEAWWQTMDLSVADAPARWMNAVLERFGRVDVLVNNGHHQGDYQPLATSDVDGWHEIFSVNVYGPVRLIQSALPAMRRGGGGSIVNINSGAAVNANPNLGAYAASKAAMALITRTLAVEAGRDNVRVNGVYVSSMVGDNLMAWGRSQAEHAGVPFDEWFARKQESEFALGKMPCPDDVADVVLFLASRLSRSVTGHNLVANNGQWVVGPQ